MSMGSVMRYFALPAIVPETCVSRAVELVTEVMMDSEAYGVRDSIGPGKLVVSPTRRTAPSKPATNVVAPDRVTVVPERAMVPAREFASWPEYRSDLGSLR
jgi:hypothetical protein